MLTVAVGEPVGAPRMPAGAEASQADRPGVSIAVRRRLTRVLAGGVVVEERGRAVERRAPLSSSPSPHARRAFNPSA